MREEPEISDLLAVVSEFLQQQLLPVLDGKLAFETRIAVNLLDICRREIDTGTKAEEQERQRLTTLLDQQGSAADLNNSLCARIRNGDLRHDDPALVQHLWASTLDTLAIDQPRYATYRRALELARQSQKGEN